MAKSPYQQLREIEVMFNGRRPGPEAERAVMTAYNQLQKRLTLTVVMLRDYERSELEEDTKAQLRILPKAVKSLEQVRESILVASEYDIVGAVDVAELSVEIDQLIERLR